MFCFSQHRLGRKPSLTPMIDVVFLLLIFFMLASQFGRNTTMPLTSEDGTAGSYSGPPRLIEIYPDRLALNGTQINAVELHAAVQALVRKPEDIIVLRGREGANVQRIIEVTQALRDNGFQRIVLVE